MTAASEVSHGRGGAGNIHPDDTPYVDGSVVRAGPEGSHGDGAYSVGRGGERADFSPFGGSTIFPDSHYLAPSQTAGHLKTGFPTPVVSRPSKNTKD